MKTPNKHILYIEDHDDTRELLTLALAQLNYHVTASSSVEDAVKLAREHDFHLYVLDSWLPDGSGIDLCKRLREFDESTPIMFFSAAAYEVDQKTAIASGAQGYIVKPADLDFLCTEVTRLIDGFTTKQNPREGCTVSYSGSSGLSIKQA